MWKGRIRSNHGALALPGQFENAQPRPIRDFLARTTRPTREFFRYFWDRSTLRDCRNAAESAGLDLKAEWVLHKGGRGYIADKVNVLLEERRDDARAFEHLKNYAEKKLTKTKMESRQVAWHFILDKMYTKRAEQTEQPIQKEAWLQVAAMHAKAAKLLDEAYQLEVRIANLESRPLQILRWIKSAGQDFVSTLEAIRQLPKADGVEMESERLIGEGRLTLAGMVARFDPAQGDLLSRSVEEQLEIIRKTAQ